VRNRVASALYLTRAGARRTRRPYETECGAGERDRPGGIFALLQTRKECYYVYSTTRLYLQRLAACLPPVAR
jgi:hypothetical protein